MFFPGPYRVKVFGTNGPFHPLNLVFLLFTTEELLNGVICEKMTSRYFYLVLQQIPVESVNHLRPHSNFSLFIPFFPFTNCWLVKVTLVVLLAFCPKILGGSGDI